ncbi:MAG TPA: nuclease-related domain-containing protein [Bacillus sp. (in: firmicutes)]|uniref:nuclease-related domain-containing protein n=1 Tax=Bacillus litorisediminis TaxID=2922713 RepID=UPI001FAC0EB1|nr:nuclease-related domain-containing protein [Bacillus litorisediminis]HWO75718.1 nuclease-related domain-containing protein [Bacillus sp. (in: firmicutes)]
MPYKRRTETSELQILSFLNSRMSFSEKEKQIYYYLKKGFEGEVLFDSLTEKLQCDCIIINDLLLKLNNTTFQIDCIIITGENIHFFEVKNYDGDYYYEAGRFYKKPKSEVADPLNQLSRTESLFRQFLQNLGFNIPINAFVVFINPEFTLFQAPLNKPLILPTQINRYLNKVNSTATKLNQKHKTLANKLVSQHIEDSPYTQLPSFHYEQLQKGIICNKCRCISVSVKGRACLCESCGHKEPVSDAVMRSIKEFKLLFPNKKITTNIIHDWCKVVGSKKRISRILARNFRTVGVRQWTYYE